VSAEATGLLRTVAPTPGGWMEGMDPLWSLRLGTSADAAWIAELRAEVMRADLERVGVYDPTRVRTRFLAEFVPANTRVIAVGSEAVGCIAVRPGVGETWIEHFYLDTRLQGRGIGGAVLSHVLDEARVATTFRINVLRGSPARRLYERHGFRLESEDGVDLYLVARRG
jgi:GNAT superfamily N-acetyltransferase